MCTGKLDDSATDPQNAAGPVSTPLSTSVPSGAVAILRSAAFVDGPVTRRVWLSSIALEELYAGALRKDHPIIEKLEHDFDAAKRLLVPNLGDWTRTGRILARLAQKYGYESIGKARLTNDALLAMSAARTGMTIITANLRDFARLAEFRPFSWQSV
jgi:predicted nucleic acid-binding protein